MTNNRIAVQALRVSIAYGEKEAERLSKVIMYSAAPDIVKLAKRDLERLSKRIQAWREELARLEDR